MSCCAVNCERIACVRTRADKRESQFGRGSLVANMLIASALPRGSFEILAFASIAAQEQYRLRGSCSVGSEALHTLDCLV